MPRVQSFIKSRTLSTLALSFYLTKEIDIVINVLEKETDEGRKISYLVCAEGWDAARDRTPIWCSSQDMQLLLRGDLLVWQGPQAERLWTSVCYWMIRRQREGLGRRKEWY